MKICNHSPATIDRKSWSNSFHRQAEARYWNRIQNEQDGLMREQGFELVGEAPLGNATD